MEPDMHECLECGLHTRHEEECVTGLSEALADTRRERDAALQSAADWKGNFDAEHEAYVAASARAEAAEAALRKVAVWLALKEPIIAKQVADHALGEADQPRGRDPDADLPAWDSHAAPHVDPEPQADASERLAELLGAEMDRIPHGPDGWCPGSYSVGGAWHARGGHAPGEHERHRKWPCEICSRFNAMGAALAAHRRAHGT